MEKKRKPFVALMALLLLSFCSLVLKSETLTLFTSYPAPSGVYQSILTTGGSVVSPVNSILVRDGGSVGVGTASPKFPAPSGTTNRGNLDANDVYLRGISRWASQTMINSSQVTLYSVTPLTTAWVTTPMGAHAFCALSGVGRGCGCNIYLSGTDWFLQGSEVISGSGCSCFGDCLQ